MENGYEGDGTEGRTFGSGFHARRKRQAEKAPTDGAVYERYFASGTGADAQDAEGVVRPEAPGMDAVVFSEAADMDADEACKIYIGKRDGSNAKKCAEENVCQERSDSAEENRRHSREHRRHSWERSYPMRTQYQDRD